MPKIIELAWEVERQVAGRRRIERVVHNMHHDGTTSKMWNGTPIKRHVGYINFFGAIRKVEQWVDYDEIPTTNWSTDCWQEVGVDLGISRRVICR
jgi:hypothetical protein